MPSPPFTSTVPTIQDMVDEAVTRAVDAAFARHLPGTQGAVVVLEEVGALLGLRPADDVIAAVKEVRDHARLDHDLLQKSQNELAAVKREFAQFCDQLEPLLQRRR